MLGSCITTTCSIRANKDLTTKLAKSQLEEKERELDEEKKKAETV